MKTISPKQVTFINDLMASRVNGATYVKTQIGSKALDEISGSLATNIIGVLLNEPKVAKAAPKNLVKETGMYTGADGHLYKVQESKWNPGKFYAKRLVLKNGPEGPYRGFEYDPSGIKQCSPESKMALGEAVAYGKQYGVCCNCGRTLTDETSIANGLGPICIKKF